MGCLEYRFRSAILGCETCITVTIPSLARSMPGASLDEIYPEGLKFPTLYMMHGGGGDCTSWVRNTMLEVYAQEKMLMTVTCDLQQSFCSDMKYGYNYFTYMTEELMRIVQRQFPSSPLRKDNFVAGFSMGGHCAMKVALRCPEKFAAVLAMSGAKDIVKMAKFAIEKGIGSGGMQELCAFGPIDEIYGSENDLLYLAKALVESDRPRPKIYHSCGKEDYGIKFCEDYKEYLDSIGLENEFFAPHGVHDYYYAGAMLEKGIKELFAIESPIKK